MTKGNHEVLVNVWIAIKDNTVCEAIRKEGITTITVVLDALDCWVIDNFAWFTKQVNDFKFLTSCTINISNCSFLSILEVSYYFHDFRGFYRNICHFSYFHTVWCKSDNLWRRNSWEASLSTWPCFIIDSACNKINVSQTFEIKNFDVVVASQAAFFEDILDCTCHIGTVFEHLYAIWPNWTIDIIWIYNFTCNWCWHIWINKNQTFTKNNFEDLIKVRVTIVSVVKGCRITIVDELITLFEQVCDLFISRVVNLLTWASNDDITSQFWLIKLIHVKDNSFLLILSINHVGILTWVFWSNKGLFRNVTKNIWNNCFHSHGWIFRIVVVVWSRCIFNRCTILIHWNNLTKLCVSNCIFHFWKVRANFKSTSLTFICKESFNNWNFYDIISEAFLIPSAGLFHLVKLTMETEAILDVNNWIFVACTLEGNRLFSILRDIIQDWLINQGLI